MGRTPPPSIILLCSTFPLFLLVDLKPLFLVFSVHLLLWLRPYHVKLPEELAGVGWGVSCKSIANQLLNLKNDPLCHLQQDNCETATNMVA